MSIIITPSMEKLVKQMWQHVNKSVWNGQRATMHSWYFRNAHWQHEKTGTSLLFTRDKGLHSSGWFKNPDYERCYHLSLSFWDAETDPTNPIPRPYESPLATIWVRLMFGDWTRLIWEEGPSEPLPAEVHHFRLMCDQHWQPILPRGEVYSRDFTEKEWKSWSDVQYEKQQATKRLIDRLS